MYRGYLLYGLMVLALFGYAQHRGWSLGGDTVSGNRGSGWHWNWGGSSGDGWGSGGGGFHK
jgi:hypothetical protein